MLAAMLVALLFSKLSSQIVLPVFVLIWGLYARQENLFAQQKQIFKKQYLSQWQPVLALVSLFLLVAGMSLLWTAYPEKGLEQFVKLLVLAFLCFMGMMLAKRDVDLPAYKGLVVTFFLTTLLLVFFHLYTSISPKKLNSIGIPYVLFFWIVLAVVSLIPEWKKYRFLLWGGLAILAMAVAYLSDSQGGMLSLLIGMMIFWMTYLWPDFIPKVIAALAALVGFIMPLLVYIMGRLPDIWTKTDFLRHAAAAHRMQIWQTSVEGILHYPWLGWGLASSGMFRKRPDLPHLFAQRYVYDGKLDFGYHSHNVFLQIWLDMGLLGAVVLSLFVFYFGRQILAIDKTLRPYAAALFTATLFIASVSYGAYRTWWLATLVILILAFPKPSDLLSKS